MTQPVAHLFADPVAASAYAVHRAAQVEEYGTYEATEAIMVGSVCAFQPGHPVPKSTVEANPWLLDKVRRVGPPVQPGVDRAEQLRARAAQLRAEQEAIDAELAAQETAQQSQQDADAGQSGVKRAAARRQARKNEG